MHVLLRREDIVLEPALQGHATGLSRNVLLGGHVGTTHTGLVLVEITDGAVDQHLHSYEGSFYVLSGEPVLYCSQCVRLHLRKESAAIEEHVAQAREIRQRTRRRDWGCRIASLFLPGAHLAISGRSLASFSTLFLFLFFVAVAAINVTFFDVRPLPPPHGRRLILYAPLAAAALVWLGSQGSAWKESHGP